MAMTTALPPDRAVDRVGVPVASREPSTHSSAVSWAAIFAGATAAAALSLIMLILGTGLGLSSVSPWSQAGIAATTFGVSTIVWITFTQLVASGMGGYLAGRLRTTWAGVHTDEVYFRDTAHGFLAWAIASLATAAMLGSVIGSIVSGGAQVGAAVAGGAASVVGTAGAAATGSMAKDSGTSGSTDPSGYFMDSLFRKDPSAAGNAPASTDGPAPAAEAGRIFASALHTGTLPPDDAHYLGQVVAQRTGLAPADADKRVTDTFNRMQTSIQQAKDAAAQAADKARKASAYAALWLFVSLLFGAFVASLSATFGGRRRDL